MAILVLSDSEDAHGLHMLSVLRARGHDAELLDAASVPGSTRLTLGIADREATLRLPAGRVLEAGSITSVYWRMYRLPVVGPLPHAGQQFVAENDARSLVESFLIRTPCQWVNGWNAFRLHQTKPVQFSIVAALGIAVPDSIFTNDPAEVLRFAGRHPRFVFKPVQGGAHARTLDRSQLDGERLDTLSIAPVTLQEEIVGTNVRAFVAGDHVVACEINTPHLDYRDDADPAIAATSLPEDVACACREIARALDLAWTGIDLRRTPDGRHIFLEANPSPMFLGFEERCGLPLTDLLVDLLTGGIAGRREPHGWGNDRHTLS
jgi:hypothetical protein